MNSLQRYVAAFLASALVVSQGLYDLDNSHFLENLKLPPYQAHDFFSEFIITLRGWNISL